MNTLTTEFKIENAKNFAEFHNSPIFGLGIYEENDLIPDSVYLEIWDYIWENLKDDEILLGVEPYIELSKFDTKSGQTEIFTVNGDISFLLDYDRSGLKEWTVKEILAHHDYEYNDILINTLTGTTALASEWADDFVRGWGENDYYLPSMFYSLELIDWN